MASFCDKHSRNMIPSKFGGEWCPDCYDEKKKGGFRPAVQINSEKDALIMEEVAGINARLDKLIAYVIKNIPEK